MRFSRGDVISRKYEIEEHLGTGIFGTTYLARHIASGRHVVVKFLRPDLITGDGGMARFEAAFAKAKTVRNPGLVRYGEINQHNDLPYLTEEYFKSESLRQVIDHHVSAAEPFTLQDTCQIVIKVLEALQVAHEQGLVHRNVKPENILVRTTRSGPGGSRIVRAIKVTDIGIPDMVSGDALGDRYDSEFDSSYMAPELLSYTQPGQPQSDIYSIGVILYELLCGQVPKGTFFSPTQVRDDLPEHVDHLVELALSPEPGDRYPTARDMIKDIQRSFQLDIQEGGRQGPNIRNIMIALAVALLATVGVGMYLSVDDTDPLDEARKRDEIIRRQVQLENPLPSEAEIKAMQAQHPDMAYVPGGTFVMGRLLQEDPKVVSPSEPAAKKTEAPAFFIDRFEFPNRPGELPTGKVSFKEAQETCGAKGKRLCTAVEWEKACKGVPNFIYAYGDTWDPAMCGSAMDEAYQLGSRKDCISNYGVFDMSGGFREWTDSSPPNKPDRKVVKGGLRGNAERGSRCAFSVDEDAGYAEATLTFRCCISAQ
ncbi:MAG: protein kinase [Alphaproteobacteria bacterium]|nr:protein kinase [Alphaproteobacteria bacterium]